MSFPIKEKIWKGNTYNLIKGFTYMGFGVPIYA